MLVGFLNVKVVFSIFWYDFVLVIDDLNLGLINLGQLWDYLVDKVLGFIVYVEDDCLELLQLDCSMDNELVVSLVVEVGYNLLIINSYCFSSYLECDFVFYQEQNSSLDDVMVFIIGVFNVVVVFFDVEDIEVMILEIFIWIMLDGYFINNFSDVLDVFLDVMVIGFNGDLVYFIFCNFNNLGGCVYVNVVCNSNLSLCMVYSNINVIYNEFLQYSWMVNVLVYEIGYNLGF